MNISQNKLKCFIYLLPKRTGIFSTVNKYCLNLEYYLHLFDVTQGDLNWDNEEVRKEIYKIVNFWINKGVKGFRLDVINLISKPETFDNDSIGDGRRFYTDGPNIHKYLKELE